MNILRHFFWQLMNNAQMLALNMSTEFESQILCEGDIYVSSNNGLSFGLQWKIKLLCSNMCACRN